MGCETLDWGMDGGIVGLGLNFSSLSDCHHDLRLLSRSKLPCDKLNSDSERGRRINEDMHDGLRGLHDM